jgi:hypothetical protein
MILIRKAEIHFSESCLLFGNQLGVTANAARLQG